MRHRIPVLAAAAALLGLFMIPDTIQADEGMWLFNNPPRATQRSTASSPPTSGSTTSGSPASGSTPAAPAASSRPTAW